jgi:hypothetical protein
LRLTKEPTRKQRSIILRNMLNSDYWLVVEETEHELVVIYRHGKTVKRLDKHVNVWKGRVKE